MKRQLKDDGFNRVVCWFSCGAVSAVATKLAIKKYGLNRCEIVYIDTGSEHPDNKRFIADCEKWFGKAIRILRSEKYSDIFDVFEKKKYIEGRSGAPCTSELKIAVRQKFERFDDIQVFGFTYDEQDRQDRLNENFEIMCDPLVIESNLSKGDCLSLVLNAGIQIPEMYRLGYPNNNCIGCPKGGAYYWNKIRKDFPETFERMATLEESINCHILKDGDKRIKLRELKEGTGRDTASFPSCSFFCYELGNL